MRVRARRGGRGVDGSGQPEEVGALAGVEHQGAGQRVEDLFGDLDVAGLFEPGVPGDADGGELRDLLAAQARRAPATAAGQSDLLRRDALTAVAQEGGELVPPDLAAAGGDGAVRLGVHRPGRSHGHRPLSGVDGLHRPGSGALLRHRRHACQPAVRRNLLPGSASTRIRTSCWYQSEVRRSLEDVTETGTLETAQSARPAQRPVCSGLGLFTVLLGAALPLIDFFIVNVALPTIGRDLNASEAVLELVVAGYGVAYAVLLVLGGRLGDLFGRRRLFLGGMAAFGDLPGVRARAQRLDAGGGARRAGAASRRCCRRGARHHPGGDGRPAPRQGHGPADGATAGLSMVAGQRPAASSSRTSRAPAGARGFPP